ncbi:MAG TPA: hypothetical protein VLT85_07130, partial [Terriglobales bacterium]|nr:hypothetical protein [Terriglobales bacterium]
MVLLQPRLNLRVSQKQILTPGLVQMVSVLALNKLELKDMITAEIMENPILEELDAQVPLLDEVAGRQEQREREEVPEEPVLANEKKDPFDEIDFGSFFQNYLDPGYRSPQSEEIDKPSFENFLSRPATLTDHLMWQLGAMSVRPEVREAAELIIGNLNEDGYLTASDDELLGLVAAEAGVPMPSEEDEEEEEAPPAAAAAVPPVTEPAAVAAAAAPAPVPVAVEAAPPAAKPAFDRAALQEAIELVRQMDPVGVAARDLRECLLAQLRYHQHVHQTRANGHANGADTAQLLADALALVDTQ